MTLFFRSHLPTDWEHRDHLDLFSGPTRVNLSAASPRSFANTTTSRANGADPCDAIPRRPSVPLLIPPPVVPSASQTSTPRSVPASPPVIQTDLRSNVSGQHLDDQTLGSDSRFNGFAGFLASLALHLILLITLALLVRPESSPLKLVMEFSPFEEGEMAFETADVVSFEPPISSEPKEQMASVNLELFEDISELEMPSRGASIITAESSRSESDAPSENTKPEPKPDEGIRFFGTKAYGNSFVYVLDMSGSMAAGGGGRMARARKELIRSINELQPHQTFCVLLYSNWVRQMFDERQLAKLHPATPEVKNKVASWLQSIRPNGGTRPATALQTAGRLQPDAVFFLSDGEFEYQAPAGIHSAVEGFLQRFGSARPNALRGNMLGPFPQEVLAKYDPKIVVHTIALESEASRRMMKRISDEKGGQHMFIPAPNRNGMARR